MSAISLISLVVVLIAINCQLIASNECSCQFCTETDESSTLKAVYILMRHGIRAPMSTYPLDPFANTTRYPNGGSQLTDSGIEQAYNMGKYIKNKYNQFLNGKKRSAFLRASPVQRCIDTVSIVTKKIWPPEVEDKKSWQPMIFSLPKQFDKMLYEGTDCPRILEAQENSLKTEEVKDWESDPKIQELYNFTAKKTGLPPNMVTAIIAYDTLQSAKYSGLQSPDWATPQIFERLGDISTNFYNFMSKSKVMQQLKAGPILVDFITQMDNVINSKPGHKAKDVFIHGTHDSKIVALLHALGDPPTKHPPFLSTFILELHRIGDKHVVRAHYVNNTYDWPFSGTKINLSKCKQQAAKSSNYWPPGILFGDDQDECTFDNFVDSVADLTSYDWRIECPIDHNYDPFKAAEHSLGNTD